MGYTEAQFVAALKPCPNCHSGDWLFDFYEYGRTAGRVSVWVECKRCGHVFNASHPGELARKLKTGERWYRRSVPSSYAYTYSTRPMRAAERRFAHAAKLDPEVIETDANLTRRNKRFVWNFW